MSEERIVTMLRISTRAMIALGVFLFMGCGPATTSIKPGTMPEGGSYHGVWHSTQYGRMELCDSSGTVIGEYMKDSRHGRIRGRVTGDLLKFQWEEEKMVVRGRPNVSSGKGYFKLVRTDEGGYRLEGEWGYGDDEIGGGPWTAALLRNARPDNCYANVRRADGTKASGDPFGDEDDDDDYDF